MTETLKGILPVLPTPYREDGSVDAEAIRRLARFSIRSGAAGLVFPGFASEVEFLTRGERTTLLRVVADECGGRVALVAGASADTASEVAAYGTTAWQFGIDFLMIQPPKSVGREPTAVIEFFRDVLRDLPEIGIVLQNAPAPRGSNLSPECMLEVTRAFRQVKYVKEETLPAGPAISYLLANKPEHLKGVIGGGGARYIIDEYSRGACAAMPALELVDRHVELDKAWRSGKRSEARRIYVKTLPLLTLQAVYRMKLTKYVLMHRGILDNTLVRASVPPLDHYTIREIDEGLALLGSSKTRLGKETGGS